MIRRTPRSTPLYSSAASDVYKRQGMGPVIAEEVDRKINGINGVTNVKVDLVWEPMWNRDMMSEEAKLELGML